MVTRALQAPSPPTCRPWQPLRPVYGRCGSGQTRLPSHLWTCLPGPLSGYAHLALLPLGHPSPLRASLLLPGGSPLHVQHTFHASDGPCEAFLLFSSGQPPPQEPEHRSFTCTAGFSSETLPELLLLLQFHFPNSSSQPHQSILYCVSEPPLIPCLLKKDKN